jgi:DUF4097 and DUF4098 domain-containing protein YvlB
MNIRYALIILLAAGAVAMPAAARGQTEPERIVRTVRTHVSEIATAIELAAKGKAYQRGDNRYQQTERITKTLNLGASGELDVSNLSGNITVTRGGGNDATIDVTKIGHGRTEEEARQMLAFVDVQITERARRGEARTIYRRIENAPRGRRNINVTVNYVITAPAGTRLVVKTLSGNVTVSDIKGELSLISTSGHVKIANAERITNAKSTSGDVEITNTRLDAPLEASTVSGSVILRKTRAPRLDLGTVSGNVVMADVECERAEAHTLSGEVTFEGPLARNGRYEFNSHSGNVRLTILGDVGFEVEANTFSGTVRLDPPLRLSGAEPASDRGRRNRSISGVHGDGSAVLDITTFSGNVLITKR